MSGCIFCSIVAGTAPAEVVDENDRALAIMDINPVADGHILVISKDHAADIWDLAADDGVAVWMLATDVAAAILDGLEPDGLTLFQANRSAGWQDVFHFHLHLVPRWHGDDLVRPWKPSDTRRSNIPQIAARIVAAVANRP